MILWIKQKMNYKYKMNNKFMNNNYCLKIYKIINQYNFMIIKNKIFQIFMTYFKMKQIEIYLLNNQCSKNMIHLFKINKHMMKLIF